MLMGIVVLNLLNLGFYLDNPPTRDDVLKSLDVCEWSPNGATLLQGRESYITTRNSRVIVEFWWVVDEKGVERFKWIGLRIRSDADQFVPYRNMGERKKNKRSSQAARLAVEGC